MILEQLVICVQKYKNYINFDPYITPYTKANSKYTIDLIVKPETIQY